MAMTVKSTKLYMVFTLSDGKDYTISLPDPVDGVDSAAVTPVMQSMITASFITYGNATLSAIKDAYVRQISENDLGV